MSFVGSSELFKTTAEDSRLVNRTTHISSCVPTSELFKGPVMLLTGLSFPKKQVVCSPYILAVWLFALHLGRNFDPTNCICEAPSECNNCIISDVYQTKTLFSAMCDRHNLTSVPMVTPQYHLGAIYLVQCNQQDICRDYGGVPKFEGTVSQCKQIDNNY